MLHMKTTLCYCAAAILSAAGCSLFDPQAPEAFGDMQINVRFAEANGNAVGPSSAILSQPNRSAPAQALDRFVIIVSEYAPQQEQRGREIVRREIFVDANGQARAVVRVPLREQELNYFNVAVQAFERLNLLYAGQSFVSFAGNNKSAAVDILLQPEAFSTSLPADLSSQPNRILSSQAVARDSSVTDFSFAGNDIGVTVPVGRANQVVNSIFLWGDTTVVRVAAWQNRIFRGEVKRRLRYSGLPANILVAGVWNQPVNFDLEIVNPLQQRISALSPGDAIDSNGLMQITDATFGPEVYEWRTGQIVSGPFIVNVTRPNAGVIGNGTVYLIRREGLPQQSVDPIPFEFRLLDTQNTKQVFSFTWP